VSIGPISVNTFVLRPISDTNWNKSVWSR